MRLWILFNPYHARILAFTSLSAAQKHLISNGYVKKTSNFNKREIKYSCQLGIPYIHKSYKSSVYYMRIIATMDSTIERNRLCC